MIAPEGGAQHPIGGLYAFVDQYPRDRKSVPHAFGHSNDIRLNVIMLKSKELPASTVTALYFVRYKNHLMLLAQFCNMIIEPLGWHIQSAYTLDRDRKSTRLNSSHVKISYAVFCL